MATKQTAEYHREYRRRNLEKVRGNEKKYQNKEEARLNKAIYRKKYYAENRERLLAVNKKWRDTNRKYLNELSKGERKEKIRVRLSLRYAVKKGLIEKKPCEKCGNVRSQGHHIDYKKPLDVIWLCQKHHSEVHRKYKF